VILRTVVAVVVVSVTLLVFRRQTGGHSRHLPIAAVTTMNWLRGLAATAVLLGHIRGLFMVDFEALERPSIAWKAFYLLSGMGHQAVIVFFILSGFLIGSTALAQMAEGRWQLREYLSRRMARLYVVLIPGLILTGIWDSAGMHLFGTEGVYAGVIDARHLTLPDVRATLSWGHLFGNLAFLQHLFISPFGSNGPLWSLPYEFWAYVLFPFLLLASNGQVSKGRRVLYALLAAVVITAGGWKLGLYLGVWLVGAVLALWWRHAETRPVPWWLGVSIAGAFAAALVLGRISKFGDTASDLIVGVATAAFLGVFLTLPGKEHASRVGRLGGRAAARLADFSYTLYVAHYPVLTFLFAATMASGRWLPTAEAVAKVCGLLTALLLYAFVVAQLTEAHTDKIRRTISTKRGKLGRTAAD
jgi:peptidoglycan/LPS O-acetylase OafA/YrhL